MATDIAVAVVQENERFVVGPRPASGVLPGLWEFPGGKVEPGESPESAAVRECREEANLDVEVSDLLDLTTHDYAHGSVRLHFFRCRLTGKGDLPKLPFRWVSRSEIARLDFPPANRALIDLLTHKGAVDA